jgi:hypothetical protein
MYATFPLKLHTTNPKAVFNLRNFAQAKGAHLHRQKPPVLFWQLCQAVPHTIHYQEWGGVCGGDFSFFS